MSKTVGILGGIGPEATCDLMLRVIRATPASDDQDHIRMIVDCDPKVPSRVKAILENTGDPETYLVEMASRLESWGADLLAMPCNSAHHYHDRIQAAVDIPLLNMIELTCEKLAEAGVQRAGFLCSSNVIEAKLFPEPLQKLGIETLYPEPPVQQRLMSVIDAVKTGSMGPPEEQDLLAAADNMVDKGADILVIACTELSTLSHLVDLSVTIVDSAEILARQIVVLAR